MHGKVLDIEGGSKQKGAKVVMFDQKAASDADNQLWFEDRYGNIRSKLNERLIFDGSGELATYLAALLLSLFLRIAKSIAYIMDCCVNVRIRFHSV